jgi:hypothetical protein
MPRHSTYDRSYRRPHHRSHMLRGVSWGFTSSIAVLVALELDPALGRLVPVHVRCALTSCSVHPCLVVRLLIHTTSVACALLLTTSVVRSVESHLVGEHRIGDRPCGRIFAPLQRRMSFSFTMGLHVGLPFPVPFAVLPQRLPFPCRPSVSEPSGIPPPGFHLEPLPP